MVQNQHFNLTTWNRAVQTWGNEQERNNIEYIRIFIDFTRPRKMVPSVYNPLLCGGIVYFLAVWDLWRWKYMWFSSVFVFLFVFTPLAKRTSTYTRHKLMSHLREICLQTMWVFCLPLNFRMQVGEGLRSSKWPLTSGKCAFRFQQSAVVVYLTRFPLSSTSRVTFLWTNLMLYILASVWLYMRA